MDEVNSVADSSEKIRESVFKNTAAITIPSSIASTSGCSSQNMNGKTPSEHIKQSQKFFSAEQEEEIYKQATLIGGSSFEEMVPILLESSAGQNEAVAGWISKPAKKKKKSKLKPNKKVVTETLQSMRGYLIEVGFLVVKEDGTEHYVIPEEYKKLSSSGCNVLLEKYDKWKAKNSEEGVNVAKLTAASASHTGPSGKSSQFGDESADDANATSVKPQPYLMNSAKKNKNLAQKNDDVISGKEDMAETIRDSNVLEEVEQISNDPVEIVKEAVEKPIDVSANKCSRVYRGRKTVTPNLNRTTTFMRGLEPVEIVKEAVEKPTDVLANRCGRIYRGRKTVTPNLTRTTTFMRGLEPVEKPNDVVANRWGKTYGGHKKLTPNLTRTPTFMRGLKPIEIVKEAVEKPNDVLANRWGRTYRGRKKVTPNLTRATPVIRDLEQVPLPQSAPFCRESVMGPIESDPFMVKRATISTESTFSCFDVDEDGANSISEDEMTRRYGRTYGRKNSPAKGAEQVTLSESESSASSSVNSIICGENSIRGKQVEWKFDDSVRVDEENVVETLEDEMTRRYGRTYGCKNSPAKDAEWDALSESESSASSSVNTIICGEDSVGEKQVEWKSDDSVRVDEENVVETLEDEMTRRYGRTYGRKNSLVKGVERIALSESESSASSSINTIMCGEDSMRGKELEKECSDTAQVGNAEKSSVGKGKHRMGYKDVAPNLVIRSRKSSPVPKEVPAGETIGNSDEDIDGGNACDGKIKKAVKVTPPQIKRLTKNGTKECTIPAATKQMIKERAAKVAKFLVDTKMLMIEVMNTPDSVVLTGTKGKVREALKADAAKKEAEKEKAAENKCKRLPPSVRWSPKVRTYSKRLSSLIQESESDIPLTKAELRNLKPPTPPVTDPRPKIVIHNVVANAVFNTTLDLVKLYSNLMFTEYNPLRFPALILKTLQPKATALLFTSGKMVICGGKSVPFIQEVVSLIVSLVKRADHPQVEYCDVNINNVMGVCDLKFPIRLDKMYENYFTMCRYEPEIFPALVYKLPEPRVTLLIFVNGKVVITGGKSASMLQKALEIMYPILHSYRMHC